jgi:hypothetical protein
VLVLRLILRLILGLGLMLGLMLRLGLSLRLRLMLRLMLMLGQHTEGVGVGGEAGQTKAGSLAGADDGRTVSVALQRLLNQLLILRLHAKQ